ncbi:MAG: hypothetical protein E6J90_41765 [Deltaproteobacteria bacterium]|nr:MAG: hypothetical protein E6J90_41765 [Deltaproteobacteria bacterium]
MSVYCRRAMFTHRFCQRYCASIKFCTRRESDVRCSVMRIITAFRTILLLGCFVLGAAGTAEAQSPTELVSLVRRSGFIFEGTVRASQGTEPAVVVVDRVLEALPPAGEMKGQEVRVRIKDQKRSKPGQRSIYFTVVTSAGKTLVLDEVGALPPENVDQLEKRIRDARKTIADEGLAKRLKSASWVVLGSAEPPDKAATREPVSEHDPMWKPTPIRIGEILRGKKVDALSVNVAESTDVVWQEAPKPKPGEKRIFLLQPSSERDRWTKTRGLFLVDPLDSLPASELDRVRGLLKGIR